MIFAKSLKNRIVDANELAYVIRDDHPVVALHTLIIPKRHEDNYFMLGQAEINSCNQLMKRASEAIMNEDGSVRAFNIGINNEPMAGQTIHHCHIHLIPRREGDVINPRGGQEFNAFERRSLKFPNFNKTGGEFSSGRISEHLMARPPDGASSRSLHHSRF